jgi:hypothetical protein
MNEKMTITNVAGKNLPETLAKSFTALANVLSAGIANAKATAEKCFELRTNPEFSAVFPDADYKKIVDSAFNGIITGNTAYKYAQCFELYHEKSDIWEYFPIGKMIITSRLENNSNVTGRSTVKFVQWCGFDYNERIKSALDAWRDKNAKQLEKIAFLEKNGFDATADKKLLSPEPKEKPYVSTGDITADTEYYNATGLAFILRRTDKELKELVNTYIDANLTDKEKADKAKKDAEKADKTDEKADKTPNPLDTAISALTAYTSTLQTVPPEYTKALLKLKADKAKAGENA